MTDATRRLATIVALDVAGYSARTEADEARTTAEVAHLRQVIEDIAARHAGRVFNTAGDGFMLEFGSSLSAVEAAAELAAACEPKVRVGVHLGDVAVQSNGDLLGHGVNVAARLMAKAEPGSALVSADVRRTIRGSLADRLTSRGVMQLDKMTEAIEAFVLGEVRRAKATPQDNIPVLAVLPFDNLSSDPEMQFFSDGVAEDIQRSLIRAKNVRVIAKASSFQLRGASKSVRAAVRELGATHVLDGSVRRSGNRVRIGAQLVSGLDQNTLWSERYDRNLSDIFELQDEISTSIAGALNAQLQPTPARTSVPVEAVDLYMKARGLATTEWSPKGVSDAIELLQHAITLAPDHAQALGFLAHLRMIRSYASAAPDIAERAATKAIIDRALSLDPDCHEALSASLDLFPPLGAYAEKVRRVLRASELAPSDVTTLSLKAFGLGMVGRVRDAMQVRRTMVELAPKLGWPATQLALSMMTMGDYDSAVEVLERQIRTHPEHVHMQVARFQALLLAGKPSAAHDALTAGERVIRSEISHFSPIGGDQAMMMFRHLVEVYRQPNDQQANSFRTLLATRPLNLVLCTHAARTNHLELVIGCILEAASRKELHGGPGPQWRATETLFGSGLWCNDPRFVLICARLGLAQYWIESGEWPDCADEAPYDFRTECRKAVAAPA